MIESQWYVRLLKEIFEKKIKNKNVEIKMRSPQMGFFFCPKFILWIEERMYGIID